MIKNKKKPFVILFIFIVISSCGLFKYPEGVIYEKNGVYNSTYYDFTDYEITKKMDTNSLGFVRNKFIISNYNETPCCKGTIHFTYNKKEDIHIYQYILGDNKTPDSLKDEVTYSINFLFPEKSFMTEKDVYRNIYIQGEKHYESTRFYNIRKEKYKLMYRGRISYTDIVDSSEYSIHKFFTYTDDILSKTIYVHDSLGIIKTYGGRPGDCMEFDFEWGTAQRPLYTRALIELFNHKQFHSSGNSRVHEYIGVLNNFKLLKYTKDKDIYPEKFPLKWSYFDSNFKEKDTKD